MNLTYIANKIIAKKPSILQGFGISFGLGMTYFSLLVIIPLIALFGFCISKCAGYRRVWCGGGGERENHRTNYHDAFIH